MKKLSVIQDNKNDIEQVEFSSLTDFAQPIYLDNNATTRIDPDAADEMFRVLEKDYANPGGIHYLSLQAQKDLDNSRQYIADFIGCLKEEIIFTSSATEGINSVISSVIKTHYPLNNIITCKTEHSATLNKLKEIENITFPKYKVSYLDVDSNGQININELEVLIQNKPLLLTLMVANNETGVIHKDIFKIIEMCRKNNCLIHLDAVQIAGKLPIKPYIDSGVNFLTISGHKIHGPKGVGVLYIKKDIPFIPFIFGGNQENGYRAGTENVSGIVALGAIAKKKPVFNDNISELHKLFVSKLLKDLPSCIINGSGVWGTINVGFKYVHRDSLILKLSQYGVYAGAGSACSKGIEPSYVLKAMNVSDEYIHGSVRFSMSKYTTIAEIERSIEIIVKAYNEVRSWSMGIISEDI